MFYIEPPPHPAALVGFPVQQPECIFSITFIYNSYRMVLYYSNYASLFFNICTHPVMNKWLLMFKVLCVCLGTTGDVDGFRSKNRQKDLLGRCYLPVFYHPDTYRSRSEGGRQPEPGGEVMFDGITHHPVEPCGWRVDGAETLAEAAEGQTLIFLGGIGLMNTEVVPVHQMLLYWDTLVEGQEAKGGLGTKRVVKDHGVGDCQAVANMKECCFDESGKVVTG